MERPLTERIGPDGPMDIAAYQRAGGYASVRKALREMAPDEVVEEVTNSNLRGRGGAGFPTGKKWSFMPRGDDAPTTKYIICNADEMEPGTFKDRWLLEGDPHQLVEAMIVAGYAVGACEGYIFLPAAYVEAARRLGRAMEEARAAGWLGRNILGSGFSFSLKLHVSAGRYICGEETALLNALEGGRPIPRAKPPHPQAAGLWGRPSVVNNVETLVNVPHIVNRGADWFRGLAASEDGGTKIYGASGHVNRPGAWELPMGTTAREIIEEHAGGLRDGRTLTGFLPGGGSTGFLIDEHLDLPMDFGAIEKAGSRLGTGTIIVLDDRTCPVGMLRNLEAFFARESCGWCTPCRDGLPWTEKLLAAIEDGEGDENAIALLEHLTGALGMGRTYCAHAPGAMMPLETGLKYFRDAFDRHLAERRCPWR